MSVVLVDTCVLTDLADPASEWFEWSVSSLERLDESHQMIINPVIYAECSVGYETIEEVESLLRELTLDVEPVPREALFLAGKVFLEYRRRSGVKTSVLPDFFVGAHAAVERYKLITRDTSRFRSYFPGLDIIMPDISNPAPV